MSLYGDFRKVWVERFPESELPAAWEEDVRSNLMKHRQRVASLKEELEKEEFYVEYLQQLLADVEKQKTRAAGDGEAAGEDVSSRTDSSESGIESSENSRKFSKSCSQNSIDMCISELADSVPATPAPAPLPAERSKTSPPSGTERSISVVEETLEHIPLEARPRSLTQPNLTSFVTVIEINGKGKKKLPPKPPPKTFKPKPTSVEPEEEKKKEEKEAVDAEEAVPVAAEVAAAHEDVSPVVEMKREPPYGKIKRTPPIKVDRPVVQSSLLSRSSTELPPVNTPNEGPDQKVPDGDVQKQVQDLEGEVEYFTLEENHTLLGQTLGGAGDTQEPTPKLPAPVKKKKTSQQQDTPLVFECEPFYDSVPIDDSDPECIVEALTLPSRGPLRPSVAPSNANYVNIDYFIKQRPNPERSSSVESEDENASNHSELSRLDSTCDDFASLVSNGTYASNSSLESSGTKPGTDRGDCEGGDKIRKIIDSIIESERIYLECLNVLLQYMKALKATLSTSQPVISEDELNTVFYKIPELHAIHTAFLDGLQNRPPYGPHFRTMAENLNDYGAFLHNYGHATDTVKRRCQNCQQFADITTEIKLKSLQGQVLSLEDLLHKPVARVQKNALVLDDLLKCPNISPVDQESLKEALSLTKAFLDSFNMIETKKMFGHEDRAQRRLVKNSFMVELCEGHRKLRHLFLFNDVMACAKYKASGRDKFTFELKWYVHLNDLVISEETGNEPKEVNPPNLLSLKSQACTMRDQILRDEEKKRSGLEKQRKKLFALEAQLVLAYPDLVLRVGARGTRLYTFLLSSEFERSQWIVTVEALQSIHQQSQLPGPKNNLVSMVELQAWVTACRAFLKTNMGSYLLRSGQDESLLRGDLHVTLGALQGVAHPADLFLVLEVDSYGHYFRKARSKLICRSTSPRWDQSFVIELEGSQNLRILLYEETQERAILRGKYTLKLSLTWLSGSDEFRTVNLSTGVSLNLTLRFTAAEMSLRRVPQAKPAGFGSKIQQVCKREDRKIPFLITSCVREVERRGMTEVGIYRVSGSASDLSKLKKSFESNSYEAEQLLKEVCVHSVTGILKLYLRELPEALFTDAHYDRFLEAWNLGEDKRAQALATCFQQLPQQNQDIINFLLAHFIKVNQLESVNKMSLHNMATVFGPTLLRPSLKDFRSRDLLAKGTVDVMAQAGILHHFLVKQRVR